LMLPNSDNRPTSFSEQAEVTLVTLSRRSNLQLPLFGKLVAPKRKTPSVPEISVDKKYNAFLSEYEVRSPG